MIAPRHLNNAPITEALVDIQVKTDSDIKIDSLKSTYKLFSDLYPKESIIHRGVMGFKIDSAEGITSTMGKHSAIGHRFASEDNTQIVQFRSTGFTFSRLTPYQDWEKMRNEARRLWTYYTQTIGSANTTRLAVRYINKLSLPLPIKFKEYLTAPPVLPDALPQGIGNYLTRIVFHEPDIDAECIITQAMEGIDDNKVPIILDIDAFFHKELAMDSDELWAQLEKLRNLKNKVFFESITEKTAELCQ